MSGIQLLLNVQNSYEICTFCFNSVYQPELSKLYKHLLWSESLVLKVGKLGLYEDSCYLFKACLHYHPS